VLTLNWMKLIIRICLASMVVAALGAPAVLSRSPRKEPPAQADELHQLWSAAIDSTLRQTIKGSNQAQNVGETLMLPLHAAFRLRDAQWERSFADHFSRFAANPSTLPSEVLSRLYYFYLASQFMVLAQQNQQQDLIPPGLPELIFSEVQSVWVTKPAWEWGRQPFPGGARERVLWKLNTRRVEKSYYRVIVDEDLYLLVIAADLKAYRGTPAQQKAWNPLLDDALSIARRVFSQEVVSQPGGGWLFQPGAWTDHPEYQYAGNKEIRPEMKPAPVPGISADSSHSLRFPLWLTSLMQAYPPNSEGYQFFEGLRSGLEKQFFNKVLVKPSNNFPCYRMNNFMDGSNGAYRYNYESLGPGRGFGPYEVSGTLLLGWWAFLDTDRIRGVYRDLAATFPWPKECVEVYLGPEPTKGYSPSDFEPGSPSMRLWHLDVLLGSKI
jgi:hypothetical protein